MPRQYTFIVCAACGKKKRVSPSRAERTRYCDADCFALRRSTHGEGSPGKSSAEYLTWHGMKTRCLNPNAANYALYGGRGITVCDEWRDSYERFLADVGRKPSRAHSLDRIDGSLGYQPGNVRWSTAQEQAVNRRSTRNLTFNGITQPLTAWAEAIGMSKTCLSARLVAGWTVERALMTPVNQQFSHRR